jgi:hypothetical protein
LGLFRPLDMVAADFKGVVRCDAVVVVSLVMDGDDVCPDGRVMLRALVASWEEPDQNGIITIAIRRVGE